MQMVGEKDADLDVAIAREDRFIRGAVRIVGRTISS